MEFDRLQIIKSLRFIALLALILVCFFCVTKNMSYAEATDNEPDRIINLVYDDSKSMIIENTKNPNSEHLDRWCQAKYAMEVFAGMLGDKDTMNVYVMSDFESKGAKGAKGASYVLKGSDGRAKNVKAVHGKLTNPGRTPVYTVECALNDLEKIEDTQKEKWLVILTDGEFQGEEKDGKFQKGNVSEVIAGKSDDIKVMFLAMGQDADEIETDESKHVFCDKAENSREILNKLTGIGKRVFNRNELESKGQTIDLDIPMKELIVFAQGKEVSINGIKGDSGTFKPFEDPVTVQYSTKPTEQTDEIFKNPKVDDSLRGSLATFRDIPKGHYDLDISGAETVTVYYKPDVDILVTLYQGKKPVSDENIKAGEYTIKFSMVDTDGNKVKKSKLLGTPKYQATVTNAGKTLDQKFGDGDKITIKDGDLTIDATATYLTYYSVNTSLNLKGHADKKIAFTVIEDPGHRVGKNGFKDKEPVKLQATIGGKVPTEEEWEAMNIPKVNNAKKTSFVMGDYKIEKGKEPGVYLLTPTLPGKLSGSPYKDVDVDVKYKSKYAKTANWVGTSTVPVKLTDERSWLVKHRDIILKLSILGLLLALILGYIPGIKHYLPRRLKKRPTITSKKDMTFGQKPQISRGTFTKDRLSTFIPYKAETGTIKYVPVGVAGAPRLKVRGGGGNRNKMLITNMQDFRSKNKPCKIKFNGESAVDIANEPKTSKVFSTSAGLDIEVKYNGLTHTCNLTQ